MKSSPTPPITTAANNRTPLQAAQLDGLVQNALRTSEIEGETLNVASVRSSVINQLGLDNAGYTAGYIKGTPQTDALARLLVEATTQTQVPLSLQTLCQWQAALFPEPPQLVDLRIGHLRGEASMQVVSGRLEVALAIINGSPPTACSMSRDRWVLASCMFTVRIDRSFGEI